MPNGSHGMHTPSHRFSRSAPRDGSNQAPQRSPLNQFLATDSVLLALLLVINLFGLVMLFSSTDYNYQLVGKQASSLAIALCVMFTMAQIPPRVYHEFSPWLYAVSLFSILLVMAIGEIRLGAQRWLHIPGIGSVQPSELLKLCLPMMVAWYLARRPAPPLFLHIITVLFIIGIPVLIIAEQPDLGTALLVMASGLFILFFAGISWRFIGLLSGCVLVSIPFIWYFLLHDYQRQRVLTFLNPEHDIRNTGWNIVQSKAAIGSGGFFGKGYLEGTQSHLQFLPEGHTDFAISAISEELGLLGVLCVLILYLLIVGRVFYIATLVNQRYQKLLTASIAMSMLVYVFVNMGMVSGILPVVGVPLPFISYGGTALIVIMAHFGLVMSIFKYR